MSHLRLLYGMWERCETVIFCSDVGWRKPAQPIFRRALEHFRCPPAQCLFIGDNPRYDMLGARRAGMVPVFIDWSIDVFPLSSQADDSLLAAATAIVNTVNEHLRLCFLVEGKPFPYSEKLMRLVEDTELGRAVGSILGRPVDLVLGKAEPDRELWQRLEEAFEILNCYDLSEENRILHDAFANAMVSAGVEPDWVEADYDNIA